MDIELAALERFERAHPVHKKPRSEEPYEVRWYPSPTTAHIRVQCGCGFMERYTEVSLGGKLPERRRSAHG